MTSSASELSVPFASALRVVSALTAGPMIGLGLARFAYALLLAPMRTELHWTFAVAGFVGTANAVGYLIGAAAATPLARRFGGRTVYIAAVLTVVFGLLLSAICDPLALIIALRLLVGIAGAACFVVGGGLAAETGRRYGHRRGAMLLAVYFAGSGLGIVASGVAVPLVLAYASATDGWRIGWLALGIVALTVTAVSLPATLRAPEPARPEGRGRLRVRPMAVLLVSYFFYGTGYISYMTFIVVFLAEQGAHVGEIAGFWVALGACSVAATFLWGPVLARLRGGRGTALVLAFVTIGAIIPVLSHSFVADFASAVLFGGSFLSVVTAVTIAARQAVPAAHWTAAIGALTIAFALGQCLGPVLTGAIADRSDGVIFGLAGSALVLALASLTALMHRTPSQGTSADP